MGVMETAMSLIAGAGDAKSYSLEAISLAREGKFTQAKEILEKAKEAMVDAHDIQTGLIRNEFEGKNEEVNLLVVHAQDHLMGSMLMRELAEEFIYLYENLYELKRERC